MGWTRDRFEVEWVPTLSQALERLTTTTAIDAALLDLQLPDCADLEAVNLVVAAAPEVPLFVFGENDHDEIGQLAIDAGARDFLLTDRLDAYWLPRTILNAMFLRPRREGPIGDTDSPAATRGEVGTGLITSDVAGRITYLNRMAEALTGWPRSEAAGHSLGEVLKIVDRGTRGRIDGPVDQAAGVEPVANLPSRTLVLRRDGSESVIEHSATTLHDRAGRATGVTSVLRDISAAHAMAARLAHLASHDPLTDLPNRVLLGDRLEHSLTLAERHQQRVAVLFIDLDQFKSINDTLGHLVGDALLRRVGEGISSCVRSSDTVSRYGGDEFVVVLAELQHPEDAATGAQKILSCLAGPEMLPGHEHCITASIGISVYPDDGQDAKTLLTHADMALYQAKEKGRNRYRFFEPRLHLRATRRQSIETGLRRALERQEFELLYQPKIGLRTNSVVGAEALLRWRHPDGRLIEPAEFVTIAEDCGLIEPIGSWVLREACRQARAWSDAGAGPIPVSVNVSAVEFRKQGLLKSIISTLEATSLDPRQLEIELTEGVLITDVEATNAVLNELKVRGVQLAIDDFGIGWSSLNYLRHFPIDAIKIDASFVRDVTSNAKAAMIVSTMIRLGKTLTQRVVAEGVETPEQLAFLQTELCDEAQGYLFCPPLAAQEIGQLLENRPPSPSSAPQAFQGWPP